MATISLTTNPAHDARIAAAFGRHLALPGSANGSQIKGALIEFIRKVVEEQERDQALQAIVPGTPVDAS